MLLHNLKQIVRSLWKYKSFSLINLAGLSIGIAAIVLLLLLANYENSFDAFHADTGSIYRVVTKRDRGSDVNFVATAPYPLARLLRIEMPGLPATEVHYANEMNLKIGNREPFTEKKILFADSLFFQVFDFNGIPNFWLRGNKQSFLTEPNKAVLTESTARRYFGTEDPLGKLIRLDNKRDVQVAGIVKDIPATTHLPVNMLVTFSTVSKEFLAGLDPEHWGIRSGGYCYVKETGNTAAIEKALARLVQKEADSEDDRREKMYLQPLSAIHFDTAFETTNPSYTITAKYIGLLLLLGGFIVLIACINYINLSTSLAFSKAKEVGIRKTIGASRGQLFLHYLSETIVLTTAAALVGIGIAALCVSAVNHLLDKAISLQQALEPTYILGGLLALLFISFLSGFYPALILSGFRPIESLKNSVGTPGKFSSGLRKSLVAFQFTVSIALIICTLVFGMQTNYFSKKSLGFNKEAVVEVGLPVADSAKMAGFKALLQNQSGIKNISLCLGAPVSDNGIGTGMRRSDNPTQNESIKLLPSDINYLETYGIKLLAGRWFMPSETLYNDSATAIVVNEALVKTLGFKTPSDAIGQKITIGINDLSLPIIGVTQDFHTTSLHQRITPVGIMPFPFFYYAAAVRLQPGGTKQTLARIETAWKKIYPEYVYSVKFIDETLAKLYAQETKDYNLFKAFAGISVFICCIGLWGLIAFTVVRKTKEIGIRKVLGATVANIVGLLSKDFLKLALLGLLIASPVAGYFMNGWLQSFAYRISIAWWVFPLAGFIAGLIAFATISFQAVKAAVANPVKSLRTE